MSGGNYPGASCPGGSCPDSPTTSVRSLSFLRSLSTSLPPPYLTSVPLPLTSIPPRFGNSLTDELSQSSSLLSNLFYQSLTTTVLPPTQLLFSSRDCLSTYCRFLVMDRVFITAQSSRAFHYKFISYLISNPFLCTLSPPSFLSFIPSLHDHRAAPAATRL